MSSIVFIREQCAYVIEHPMYIEINHAVSLQMSTICDSFVADLYLYSYEADCVQYIQKK